MDSARPSQGAWRFAGYDVFELVGFGGSGEVWRARVAGTGDLVALKRLRSADAVARERLRQEAAVLSSVAGDHVVRVRDVVLTEDEAVLVMDFAAGGNFAAVLSVRGQIAAPEVVTLVGPLAMALADAHDRGIVHGDVTPANIVFDADGRPLLTDFGVARAVGTIGDLVEGTPPYLAPEVLAGRPVTPAADVFALCTVAQEALAAASAPQALIAAIQSGIADDPHDRPTARELASAVLRSCAAAPVGLVRAAPVRPAVVTETVRLGPAAPVDETPPARPTRRRKARRRRRRLRARVPARLLVSVVSLTTLVLAVVGGVTWGHRTQSSAAILPRPPAQAGSAAAPDWSVLLRRLDLIRAQALGEQTPALLEQVYVSGSAVDLADRARLRSLLAQQVRPAGLFISTLAVHPVSVTSSEATLRVTDTISAYELVRRDGRVMSRAAATPARTFTMVLARTGAGWRISAIRP